MKRSITQVVSLAAIVGFSAVTANIAQAQTTDPLLDNSADQSLFPQITIQPLDRVVPLGSNVVFSVDANNATGCQWLKNGVPLAGQTNSVLRISNVGLSDVALYSCRIFNGGPITGAIVPTRAASLQVEAADAGLNGTSSTSPTAANNLTTGPTTASMPAGGPITVYGTPQLGGGSQGTCPGAYAGYVHYSKSVSDGWGWAPKSGFTILSASDGSGRTDTKIQYIGAYGDMGCAQTTVTIPYPPYSPVYQFTIFFTNDVPTSTNYPLVLTNFNQ